MAGGPAARLRAARLLRSFRDRPEVRLALHEALLDPSTPVAFEAADTLAGEADPEALRLLRADLEAAEPGLQLGYLLYALLRQQEFLGRLIVEPELLPLLKDALREPDLFLSGAAAACLAEYLFRSTDLESLSQFEVEILHSLVKSIGGMTFYPQYARFSEIGERSLIRISGEDFSHLDRSAWLSWYAQNQVAFRAVRGKLQVTEADLPRLRISWQHGDGALRCLAGEAAGDTEAELRFLGGIGMVQLLERIEQAQLLDVRVLPGIYGSPSQVARARIELEVGPQRKPLTFRGDAAADWLPGLLRDLDAQFESLAWQDLAPPTGGREFVLSRLAQWDTADAPGRRRLEIELTRERLANLSGDELESWCAYLAADPGFEALWDADLGARFLETVPRYAARPELAGTLLRAALRRPHPELASPFVESLADMSEPLRSSLLQQGMLAFGPELAAESMRDERLPVRVAAARSLGSAGPAGLEALLEALNDPNALVVQMAARSLGQLGDPAVLPQLLPLTGGEHSKGVRGETLWALGEIGALGALEAVKRSCGLDQDPSVRLAAVEALGKLQGAGVEEVFSELFPDFAGQELELVWSRSLERRGCGVARRVLRQHLDAGDPVIAARAAVLSGRLGDPEAVGHLIRMLPRSPRDSDLLDALVTSTGVDFRGTPDPAGVYVAWWSENGLLVPAFWLERAAANGGYLLPAEFDVTERVKPALAVERLVELLEGGPVHLRPMASYFLVQLTGVDLPAFRPETPFEAVQASASTWRAWISERAAG
ncbi:MAG: HEAT repeat domain-containing protein [Planctomycetes bacterium]|nr:HEAT repeat domain-containing protein [Planctomycetota bacterium]